MQIINSSARLITINHDGKDYRLLPAGDAIEVPTKVAKDSKFLQALINDGSVKVVSDTSQPDLSFDPLDSLRAEVIALGVEVDGRWGEAKLREVLASAQSPESDQEQ